MPTILFEQPSDFEPATQDGWWDAITKTSNWTTLSADAHSWTVSLPGSQTIVFTSSAGFSALRFPSDIPTGTVDSMTFSNASGEAVRITDLGALGLSASQISADPGALVNSGVAMMGLAGGDTLAGGPGADLLAGGGGNDSIAAGDGADTLSGEAGNDTITDFGGTGSVSGGDGDDNLRSFGADVHGDAGNDTLDVFGGSASGGDGADTISASTISLPMTVTGDAGDDRIVITYAGAAISVDGGAGDDTAVVDYRGGTLTPTQVGNISLTNVEHLVISFTTVQGASNTLDLSSWPAPVNVVSETLAEHIVGTLGADTISSGGGGDTVSAGAGDDLLDGGTTPAGWEEVSFGPGPAFLRQVHTDPHYDYVDYGAAPSGVTVDLNVALQHTSLGNDTLSNFEGVLGSQFNDILVGSRGQQDTMSIGNPLAFSGSRLDGQGGDDQLFGSIEHDTLTGGAGADTLTGGLGADLFVLSTDGATDRVMDFTLAEGDKLLITGAGGAAVGGAGSVLTLHFATQTLGFDPDGDDGPRAEVAVTSFAAGPTTLDRSMLAAGVQPQYLVALNGDGSKAVTALDWGNQAFDHATTHVDAAGKASEYDSFNDDGSKSVTLFDHLSTQDWANQYWEYDAQGRLSIYAYVLDDGRHAVFTHDTVNAQPWDQVVQFFATNGVMATESIIMDDGTDNLWTFDFDSSKGYQKVLQVIGPDHLLHHQTILNDDGSAYDTAYDVANHSHVTQAYDPAGALVWTHTFRDDGTIIS